MNDLGSNELKPLDIMSSRLWMIWMILGRELMALNVMNISRLWMTWMNLGCELKTLGAMNSSRLWLTWMTPDCELRAPNVMNNSGLWMTWMTLGCPLKALDALIAGEGATSLWIHQPEVTCETSHEWGEFYLIFLLLTFYFILFFFVHVLVYLLFSF